MIPDKLQVRNFMCYGEDLPPLQLSGLHVACLTGHNGAGKSALLDALTWALWGKARAKSDDDLIALGRDEMEVVLEFKVNEQTYRVIRRRKRGKRSGTTTLDFQICEPSGTWRRLTGDTVTDTQDTITRVLRLDYDTFINSAFLLQGRADEFTGRKPAERKQVLADILGLADYEELERQAKETAQSFSKELDELRHFIDHLQAQAAQRPMLEQLLTEAQEQVAIADEELSAHELVAQELRERSAQLQTLSAERTALVQTVARDMQAQREIQAEIAQSHVNVTAFEAVIGRQSEIEAGITALHEAEAALKEMDQRRDKAYELKEEHDRWQREINELRAALELELRSASDRLAHLDEQLERRTTTEQEHARLTAELGHIGDIRVTIVRLRQDETALVEQQTIQLELQVREAELQGLINVRRDALIAAQQEHQRRIVELDVQVGRLPDIERELRELRGEQLRLQALDDELATRRDALSGALERQGELQGALQAVEAEGKAIVDKLRLVQEGATTCPVCDGELGTAGVARIIDQYTGQRDALRERVVALRQERRTTEASILEQRAAVEQIEQMLAARATVEARRAKLELQHSQAVEATTQRDKLRVTLAMLGAQLEQQAYAQEEQAQLQQLTAQLSSLGSLGTTRKKLAALRSQIAELEQQLVAAQQLEQRVTRLDVELAAISEAAAQRPAALARYEALHNQIADEAYGTAEREARDAIVAAGQTLGYRKEAHAALREEVEQLKLWEQEVPTLQRALLSIETERTQLQRLHEQNARYDEQLATARVLIATLEQQLQDQTEVELALRNAEIRSRQLQHQLQSVQRALGSAEESLRTCEKNITLLAEQQKRAALLAEERAVYDELAQAFGKKGIQAMLIETAIPEIEHEANELLGRMTENQFHLALETQRDTKKGDSTIETLDIRISDTLGTRDYQMYSGGEAFRVNFAIRIALSKLLARRAGASLKTLIIDEGFGTQDGTGRDRLVEAINTIQDDFERILIITHIQELKDMFQSQIEITKTPEGSMWAII